MEKGSPEDPGPSQLDNEAVHPKASTEQNNASEHSAQAQGTENTEYITGAKLLALDGSLILACFLILLDTSILGTAIPQITSDFESLADVGWYAGAYPLANAALQPLTGKLYTYFRAKYIFLIFLFIFELGSLICGAAQSSSMLIAGRVISGLGASGLMNGAMTIIAGSTPLEKRPLHIGIMLGISSIGLVAGPLVGGAFTQYATWRWCFYINLPVGGITAILLLIIHIPDLTYKAPVTMSLIRKVVPELDLFGFVLFAPAALMFLLALQFGSEGTHDWGEATIIGLFCGAGVTAIVFIAWEWHMGDRAMIPGSMVRQRVVWSSATVNLCLLGTMVTGAYYLPMYFQAVRGVGPSLSGVYTLPAIVAQLITAMVSGVGISKMGYYLPWAIVGGVLSTVGNGLISTLKASTSNATWIGFQIILGVGRGAGMQVASIAVQNCLPPHQIPISLAFLIFSQNLAASIFMVIASTIFTRSLVSEVKKHVPSLEPQRVLDAGGVATAVRALVPEGGEDLKGLLRAYEGSLARVWWVLAGLTGVALFACWGMGWKDVRKQKQKQGKEGDGGDGGEKV
ncbi:efflux pump protein [Aaosphaeria arxii CBS 175.79]|uniref:Efflux pump protein n=1 Tax=Aaosphaeria arxii CBS 175.79 TaxID=1450172 RepID=A0A6A5XVP0_9PLEO|nr:efflux pump protein [Aaosphaeria arxii CBS 175.79]KAF2016887.1 efflux pump protein [Aaosphaeria arxii CBS 175.79]